MKTLTEQIEYIVEQEQTKYNLIELLEAFVSDEESVLLAHLIMLEFNVSKK